MSKQKSKQVGTICKEKLSIKPLLQRFTRNRTLVAVACAFCAVAYGDKAFGLLEQVSWGESQNGVRVGIKVDKDTYTNGEPILISIVFTNSAERTFGFYRTRLGPDFEISDQTGMKVVRIAEKNAKTPFEKALAKVTVPSPSKLLAPHEALQESCPLDKLWDLSKSGTYKVTLSEGLHFPNLESPEFVINSGSIYIRIQ